jgi:hypothetical protein
MSITKKYQFKRVEFTGGNFKGKFGFCTSVDQISQDQKAIFGLRLDFKLLDGSNDKVVAYKTEHLKLAPSCDTSCGPGDYCKGGKCDNNGCWEIKNI